MARPPQRHELRAHATRELQRSVARLEAMHARMEALRQRPAGLDEVDDVREGTWLAVRSLRRIVEQLREDAG